MRLQVVVLSAVMVLSCSLTAPGDDGACLTGGAGSGELVYLADFETGRDDWVIENTPGTGVGIWSQADFCLANPPPSGGDYVMAFEFLASCNFSVLSLGLGFGLPLVGYLTSPAIDLRNATGPIALVFDYAISTDGNAARDKLTLLASEDGVVFTPIADNRPDTGLPDLCDDKASIATWKTAALDMSVYAGKRLYLRFNFDTVNETANTRPGVAFDNVRVYADSIEGEGVLDGEGGGALDGEGEGDGGTDLPPVVIDFDYYMNALVTNVLVAQLDGLIAFEPDLADLNGPLAYLNDTVAPNGMLDSAEFGLIARVLADPTIDLRGTGGLWYASVREAWQRNYAQTGIDCGVLLPSFIPGIRNLFSAYTLMGDADSMAFYVALLMLGNVAAEDAIGIALDVTIPDPQNYTRLRQWLGLFGDADGDGATNQEEYEYFTAQSMNPYVIESYATPGGTIEPAGVFGKAAGETQAFTFSTEPDYRFAGIEVDGVRYPPVPEYIFIKSRTDYLDAALNPNIYPGAKGGAIPADHTVVAVFESTIVSEGEGAVEGEGVADGEGETYTCTDSVLLDGGFELDAESSPWSGGSLLCAGGCDTGAPISGSGYARFTARMTDDVQILTQPLTFESVGACRVSLRVQTTAPGASGGIGISLGSQYIGTIAINSDYDAGAPLLSEFNFTLDTELAGQTVELELSNPFLSGADVIIDDVCFEYLPEPGEGEGGGAQEGEGEVAPIANVKLEYLSAQFEEPDFVTQAPGEPDRLYVVERKGKIKIYENGAVLPEPFLDITDRVGSLGYEMGLYSLAFHPDYATNGRFFVHYTAGFPPDDVVSTISEFARPASGNQADASSEQVIFSMLQPRAEHNGGMLAFGPVDGYLYFSLGDGGGNSLSAPLRTDNLLGKIHRISVDELVEDEDSGGALFDIPPDNPFAAEVGAEPSIYHFGLRNPWRFSFDRVTGDILIGDVGDGDREEVDRAAFDESGVNFGWPAFEGTLCRQPVPHEGEAQEGDTCDAQSAQARPPLLEQLNSFNCSIIGGYVYRGADIPALQGRYLFGNFCGGDIFSVNPVTGGALVDLSESLRAPLIRSFGEDLQGELYICANNYVAKIVPVPQAEGEGQPDGEGIANDGEGTADGEGGSEGEVDLGIVLKRERLDGTYEEPVFATYAPGEPNRLYVVERKGRIRVIDNGVLQPDAFLDIRGRVSTTGTEMGLFSVAFHPGYSVNGRFFVHYTAGTPGTNLTSRISGFLRSGESGPGDPESEIVIFEIPQPQPEHNGGMLAFGPRDGYLYFGLGDGGGDTEDAPLRPDSRFGKVHRISVDELSEDEDSGGDHYDIPGDNPFASTVGAEPSVFLSGLRNPWRFSFDRSTGDLLIGDVGDGDREEIDRAAYGESGLSFGWPGFEGTLCRTSQLPPGETCQTLAATTVFPIVEVGNPHFCAMVGGYVYRGEDIPQLQGRYLYGDFCNGYIHSVDAVTGGARVNHSDTILSPLLRSFGEDAQGELYVCNSSFVYKIVAVPSASSYHMSDTDLNGSLDLSELLRGIQFYNAGGFGCALGTNDGYGVGAGLTFECPRHDADYLEPEWVLSLSELLRLVQFFNIGAYYACSDEGATDGFCPGTR
ncbi:MAG: hypothetical protein GC168_19750 [Candidatus Hydrogenedens sp.]|nr:hypothetical protein [Candidatus Hydrogenedens sp.]